MKNLEKKEYERRMVFARQEAVKAWCSEKTSSKEMDTELAEEFAKILVVYMYEPHLGCATTEQLINEIIARIDNLDYRTIDQD